MTGLIITISASLALIFMFGVLFAIGFRPQWPDGARFVEKRGPYTLTLIVTDDARRETKETAFAPVAAMYGKALWATAQGWHIQKGGSTDDLSEAAVLLLSDAEYESREPTLKDSNAHQTWVPKRIGHGPILVVMRASLTTHAVHTGEPVIHELIHALGGSRDHKDITMWSEFGSAGPKVSVQEYARVRYNNKKEEKR